MDSPSTSFRFNALDVVRRRILVIALCCVLVPAGAIGYSLLHEKEYTATTSLLFSDPSSDLSLIDPGANIPSTDAARAAATNLDLVTLQNVADRTAAKLGGGLTGGAVSGKVKASATGRSNVIKVSATDHDPQLAARLANTFAAQYIASRREANRKRFVEARNLVDRELVTLSPEARNGSRGIALRKRSDELGVAAALQTGGAEQVQIAKPPTSPSAPRPLRNALIGAFLGLVLGLALAFLVDRIDRRLKDPSEVEALLNRPILGMIPNSKALANEADGAPLGYREPVPFGMLRANLRYFNAKRPLRSVLVTSASAREGKTTVALNLAVTAATAGSKVLLIEADLRLPTLGLILNGSGGPGLSNVLSGEYASLDDVVHQATVAQSPNGAPAITMDFALAGPIPPPNPTDLIESDRMTQALRTAEEEYDLVVVDAPPMSVPDTIPLVRAVSGVIAVVRLRKTTRDAAAHLRKQFERLDAPLLGCVINGSAPAEDYYGYSLTPEATPRSRGLKAVSGLRRKRVRA